MATAKPDLFAVEKIPLCAEVDAISTEIAGLGIPTWISVTIADGRLRSGEWCSRGHDLPFSVSRLHHGQQSAILHSVNESATIDRRGQRRVETASRLTSVSRRLTAQNGLAGFTIEELCDEVGVSRRTFFNYFRTKEDAVIGADPEAESQVFAGEFMARGSRGWPVVIDDLLELVIQHFGALEGTAHEHADFFAALDREPRLLQRFIGMSKERERQMTALVAQRESVPADDARAQAVVHILFGLLRSAGDRVHTLAGPHDFASILTDSLSAARLVMAEPTPRKAHS